MNTYLYGLFTVAGFKVVESHPTIRHVKAANDIRTLDELLQRMKPEIIFVVGDEEHGCAVNLDAESVRLVELNGEHFVCPAPVLLEGIADLRNLFTDKKGGTEG